MAGLDDSQSRGENADHHRALGTDPALGAQRIEPRQDDDHERAEGEDKAAAQDVPHVGKWQRKGIRSSDWIIMSWIKGAKSTVVRTWAIWRRMSRLLMGKALSLTSAYSPASSAGAHLS